MYFAHAFSCELNLLRNRNTHRCWTLSLQIYIHWSKKVINTNNPTSTPLRIKTKQHWKKNYTRNKKTNNCLDNLKKMSMTDPWLPGIFSYNEWLIFFMGFHVDIPGNHGFLMGLWVLDGVLVDFLWVLPRNLTWNLKMMVPQRNHLFQGLLFRFHVKFRGVKCVGTYTKPSVGGSKISGWPDGDPITEVQFLPSSQAAFCWVLGWVEAREPIKIAWIATKN